MDNKVEYKPYDKANWLKNHVLSEEQKKKKIDEKVNRAIKYMALAKKKI